MVYRDRMIIDRLLSSEQVAEAPVLTADLYNQIEAVKSASTGLKSHR